MKKITLAFLISFFFLTSYSQKKDTTKTQQPIQVPDSTVTINIIDLREFSAELKNSIPYSQYLKLTPDQVLDILFGWKKEKQSATKPNK